MALKHRIKTVATKPAGGPGLFQVQRQHELNWPRWSPRFETDSLAKCVEYLRFEMEKEIQNIVDEWAKEST